MSSPGQFVDFLLSYKGTSGLISPSTQAATILDKARDLINQGASGAMITYSANYDQTVLIEQIYAGGNWKTGTTGAHQAEVIAQMENWMGGRYTDLCDKMRIAPITTMTYTDYGGKSHADVITDDLNRIKTGLDGGWTVLGWINQDTKPAYAIGGGVAAGPDPNNPGEIRFPKPLQMMVQQSLQSFATRYSAKTGSQ